MDSVLTKLCLFIMILNNQEASNQKQVIHQEHVRTSILPFQELSQQSFCLHKAALLYLADSQFPSGLLCMSHVSTVIMTTSDTAMRMRSPLGLRRAEQDAPPNSMYQSRFICTRRR